MMSMKRSFACIYYHPPFISQNYTNILRCPQEGSANAQELKDTAYLGCATELANKILAGEVKLYNCLTSLIKHDVSPINWATHCGMGTHTDICNYLVLINKKLPLLQRMDGTAQMCPLWGGSYKDNPQSKRKAE